MQGVNAEGARIWHRQCGKPSLRANGSPDDRLREAIQNLAAQPIWIASSLALRLATPTRPSHPVPEGPHEIGLWARVREIFPFDG